MGHMYKNNHFIKNIFGKKGSISVIMIALLPLMISVFLVLLYSLGTLQLYNKTHHLCRTELLKTQEHLRLQGERLIKLNPKAKKLREQFKIAQSRLKTAISTAVPHFIAAATAYLAKVVAKQTKLRNKQQNILGIVDRIGTQQKQRLRQQLRSLPVEALQISTIRLAVQKRPFLSLTPSYFPKSQFAKKQKITASWKINLPFPAWVKNFIQPFGPLTGQCAATLRIYSQQWQSELAPVPKRFVL